MYARHPFTVVERYSATAQLLHWTTVLLVALAYIASVGSSETRIYSSVNDFSRGLHELLGMSVFALTLARVCLRTIFPSPKSPEMPAWIETGAKLGQWTIYALLVPLFDRSPHGVQPTRYGEVLLSKVCIGRICFGPDPSQLRNHGYERTPEYPGRSDGSCGELGRRQCWCTRKEECAFSPHNNLTLEPTSCISSGTERNHRIVRSSAALASAWR
jgi:Prokaryotic cytochrome b561